MVLPWLEPAHRHIRCRVVRRCREWAPKPVVIERVRHDFDAALDPEASQGVSQAVTDGNEHRCCRTDAAKRSEPCRAERACLQATAVFSVNKRQAGPL